MLEIDDKGRSGEGRTMKGGPREMKGRMRMNYPAGEEGEILR